MSRFSSSATTDSISRPVVPPAPPVTAAAEGATPADQTGPAGSRQIAHAPAALTTTSDVAFSPAVKAIQVRKGSRERYRRMDERGGWSDVITPDLRTFIEGQISVYLATASADGQPYVQHRGGPAGFLRVLDEHTIGFVDYAGNQQFITQGNLTENPRAQLFLMDYARQARVKIWGTARVVEGDGALIHALMPENYKATPEQVILFTVAAWNGNCRQHIPQRIDAPDVRLALQQRDARIAELEAEVARLTGERAGRPI